MEKKTLEELKDYIEGNAAVYSCASENIGGPYNFKKDNIYNAIKIGNKLVYSKELKIQANNKRFMGDNVASYRKNIEEFLNNAVTGNDKRTKSIIRNGINTTSSQAIVLSWKCIDKTRKLFKYIEESTPVIRSIKDSKIYIMKALFDETDVTARGKTIGKIIDGSTINSYILACHYIVKCGEPVEETIYEGSRFYDKKQLRVTFIDEDIYHGSLDEQIFQCLQIIALIYQYNENTWSPDVCKCFERHFERCLANFMYCYKKRNGLDCSAAAFLKAVNSGMFLMMPIGRALKEYNLDNNLFKYTFFANIFESNAKNIIRERDKETGYDSDRKDSDFILTKSAFQLPVVKQLFNAIINPKHDSRKESIEKTIDVLNDIYVFALELKKETGEIAGSTTSRDRYLYVNACFSEVKDIATNKDIISNSRKRLCILQEKMANLTLYSHEEIHQELENFKNYILNTIIENKFHEKRMARTGDSDSQMDALLEKILNDGKTKEEILSKLGDKLDILIGKRKEIK